MPASAQFAGTPVVDSGVVFDPNTGQVPTSASNIFVVGSDFAQITWTPTQSSTGATPANAIDFLPERNAVAFWDGGRFGDFTVLNRIVNLPGDARRIAFNGSVSSFVGDTVGGTIGGTVWFYSPTGILIGPNAFMDVGNLLLSTGAIARGENGTVTIGGAVAPIENRGVLDGNGYVALVAPGIMQAGTVQAGRTAALVAADSARLTIRENLFDIEVTVAAPGGSAPLINHTGLTQSRGAASGDAVSHTVYMVAVSRSDALGILLGGTVQATGAVVDGNAVVLAAGGDIVGGQVRVPATGVVPVGTATGIGIEKGLFPHLVQNGGFTASASGDVTMAPTADVQATGVIGVTAGGGIALGDAASIRSLGAVTLTAGKAIVTGTTSRVQSGQALRIAAGTSLATGANADIRAIGAATLSAGTTVAIGGNGSIRSGAALQVAAGADLGIGASTALLATGDAGLAAGGAIAIGDNANIQSGAALQVTAGRGMAVGANADIRALGPATFSAGNAIAIGGNGIIRSGAALQVGAGGDLGTGAGTDLVAAGGAGLAAGGAIAIGADGSVQAGQAMRIEAGRGLGIGAGATLGALGASTLLAGDALAVGSGATVTSGGDARFGAGGAIAVGNGARVTGTAALAMQADGAITLAPGSRTQAAGRVALTSGGSVGLGETAELVAGTGLDIAAGQDVTIAGTMRLVPAAGSSAVTIAAGRSIDVVTPTGTIVLRGANGALFGRLSLSAPRIVIADAATRAALAQAATPKERLALLFDNRGRIEPGGFVAADAVSLAGSQAIFVQNTGTDGDFAGVNANALTVSARPGSFPEVHVFGRGVGTGGIVVANNRLREFIVDRSYPFGSGSSVNNCLLSVASCNPVQPPSGEVVIDGPITAFPLPVQAPVSLTVELARVGDLDPRDLGLLDDPVTGSGDVTQWQDTCIEKDGRKCP